LLGLPSGSDLELTDALGTRRIAQAIAALENLLDSGDQPLAS